MEDRGITEISLRILPQRDLEAFLSDLGVAGFRHSSVPIDLAVARNQICQRTARYSGSEEIGLGHRKCGSESAPGMSNQADAFRIDHSGLEYFLGRGSHALDHG